jgi:hypothetical protein
MEDHRVKIKVEIKGIEAQGHLLQTCYNWEIYVTAGKENLLGGLPDESKVSVRGISQCRSTRNTGETTLKLARCRAI